MSINLAHKSVISKKSQQADDHVTPLSSCGPQQPQSVYASGHLCCDPWTGSVGPTDTTHEVCIHEAECTERQLYPFTIRNLSFLLVHFLSPLAAKTQTNKNSPLSWNKNRPKHCCKLQLRDRKYAALEVICDESISAPALKAKGSFLFMATLFGTGMSN